MLNHCCHILKCSLITFIIVHVSIYLAALREDVISAISILAVVYGLCMLFLNRCLTSDHMTTLHDVKSSASPFAAVLITHVAHGIFFFSFIVHHVHTSTGRQRQTDDVIISYNLTE